MKPPRPCECGCGATLRQPRNGGPRRFATDGCAEKVREAKAMEAAEDREVRLLKMRWFRKTDGERINRVRRKRRADKIHAPPKT